MVSHIPPNEFKTLFPEGNTTFIPNSTYTREPLTEINPEETEPYKKFLIKNYMLIDAQLEDAQLANL